MITGIVYGGQCIVTASYQYKNSVDKYELGGSLSIYMKNTNFSLDGSASADYKDNTEGNSERFQCTMIADVKSTESAPTTVPEAIGKKNIRNKL